MKIQAKLNHPSILLKSQLCALFCCLCFGLVLRFALIFKTAHTFFLLFLVSFARVRFGFSNFEETDKSRNEANNKTDKDNKHYEQIEPLNRTAH